MSVGLESMVQAMRESGIGSFAGVADSPLLKCIQSNLYKV